MATDKLETVAVVAVIVVFAVLVTLAVMAAPSAGDIHPQDLHTTERMNP